jgi:hypothetical protein
MFNLLFALQVKHQISPRDTGHTHLMVEILASLQYRKSIYDFASLILSRAYMWVIKNMAKSCASLKWNGSKLNPIMWKNICFLIIAFRNTYDIRIPDMFTIPKMSNRRMKQNLRNLFQSSQTKIDVYRYQNDFS